MKKLPDNLDEAMRCISNNTMAGIEVAVINQLLALSYISVKYGGGWMVNSKGRRFLKEHTSGVNHQ